MVLQNGSTATPLAPLEKMGASQTVVLTGEHKYPDMIYFHFQHVTILVCWFLVCVQAVSLILSSLQSRKLVSAHVSFARNNEWVIGLRRTILVQ